MKKGILFFDERSTYEEMENILKNNLNYYLLPYVETEEEVINMAKLNRIDVIVASASRPGNDGIDMICAVKNNTLKECKSILLASCYCDGIIRSVIKYKIDYVLYLPLDANRILRRIDDLYDDLDPIIKWNKLEKRVSETLKELGVPANIQGYSYLRAAIVLSIEDEENLDKITKMLYPSIASLYHTTSSRVERSMRHAIEIAYCRGNLDALDDYFGYTIDANKAKPTNSEFIAMIANRLKLDCYC